MCVVGVMISMIGLLMSWCRKAGLHAFQQSSTVSTANDVHMPRQLYSCKPSAAGPASGDHVAGTMATSLIKGLELTKKGFVRLE
jgi:hypothetical protein